MKEEKNAAIVIRAVALALAVCLKRKVDTSILGSIDTAKRFEKYIKGDEHD